MFREGEIVFGPFPATEGNLNVGAHHLVVIASNDEGVLAMFTTSLKEATGGQCEFNADERCAAHWAKPCRFVPDRIALFKTVDLHHLQSTGGKLSSRTVQKLVQAALKVKAAYKPFRAQQRLVA